MYRGHCEKCGTQALQGSDPGATIVDLDRRSQDPLSKQAEPLRSAPSYELFSWPQPASARSQASGESGPRTSIGRNTSSGQPGPCARGRFIHSAKEEVDIHSRKATGRRGRQLVAADGAQQRAPANRITASGRMGLVSLDLIRFKNRASFA